MNQFYGAPTALRLLMKSSDDYVTRYDRLDISGGGSHWLQPAAAKTVIYR